MVTTSRTFYPAAHKVKVLDRANELGSVANAAREYGHEPGIVYGWRHVESGIRKTAKKDSAQEAKAIAKESKEAKAALNGKQGPPPPRDVALSHSVTKKPMLADEPPSAEGPKLSVHALGPWLREVVKQELPGAVGGELEALIDQKLGDLDARLAEAVRQALKRGIG